MLYRVLTERSWLKGADLWSVASEREAGQLVSRIGDIIGNWKIAEGETTHELADLADAETEDRLSRREELNLLYVAMTRAQQALIVSGCEGRGCEDSWYEKVRHAVRAAADSDLTQDDLAIRVRHGSELAASMPDAAQSETAVAAPAQALDARLAAPLPTGVRRPGLSTRGQRYGTSFHDLMEQVTKGAPTAGDRAAIQSRLGLADRDFGLMWDSAQRLLAAPALARFFDAAQYVRAANEVAYMTRSGELRRIDRLVELEAELWVLDYKTGELPDDAGLLAQYEAQVRDYRDAISTLVPGKRVRAMLIFTSGAHREVSTAAV